MGTATQSQSNLRPAVDIIEDRSRRKGKCLPVRYSKGKFLGKGGFARCYEVQHAETRQIFAAKIVSKASIVKPRAHAKLRSEIAIHQSLDHERIVKFIDYFEDTDNVYIILEMCPNQTLNDLLRRKPQKRMSEAEAMFYTYDLISALIYLHRCRVIHRDLKLGNLFLDANMRIRLGDFGLAAILEHEGERKGTMCGTPNYIAPEILDGKNGHSFEVDIWSLGVVLYTMLIGRPPFETSDLKATYRRIRANDYSFPENVRISDPARDLIRCILRTDPYSRPSLEGILNSPWFQSTRLPPPMPVGLLPRSTSPRLDSARRSESTSCRRSETPERGVQDFARIDSPATGRCTLRERSPLSLRQVQPQVQPNNQSPQRTLAKKPWPQSASNGLPPTASTGRAVSAPRFQRKNNENLPPQKNAMGGVGTGSMPGLGLRGNVAGCPTSAHAGACTERRNEMGSRAMSTQSTTTSCPPPTDSATPQRSVSADPKADRVLAWDPRDPAEPAQLGSTGSTQTPPPLSCSGSPSEPMLPSCNSGASPRGVESMPMGSFKPASAQSVSKGLGSARSPGLTPPGRDGLVRTSPAAARRTTSGPGAQRNGMSSESPQRSGRTNSTPSVPTAAWAEPTGVGAERRPQNHSAPRCNSSPALRPGSAGRAATRPGSASSAKQQTEWLTQRSSRSALPSPLSACPSEKCFSGCIAGPTLANSSSSAALPEMWVSRWVDYSSKYGIGYVLSDGAIGVYFNDSTKAVLGPDGRRFDYITRRTQEKPEVTTSHAIDDHPEELKKKVTLLRHFKGFLLGDAGVRKNECTSGESSLPFTHPRSAQNGSNSEQPYVKKWMRNDGAILFQLSNKIVQVVFCDDTEAILSSRAHSVVYVDKRGQRCTYPITSILDVPNPELAKRLRYTKDILVQVLSGNPQVTGGRPASSDPPPPL